MSAYKVLPGPEAFLPPAAAMQGAVLPDPGYSYVEGGVMPEDQAIEHLARKLLGAKVPTFFPGPLTLWHWCDEAAKQSKALRQLAEELPARIIPMADYRPKYPKIDPAVEINPNHPNLTIWHNKIDVCMFIGVHCHQANLALKIIRGGTDCYTAALCSFCGDDEACVSIRDITFETIIKIGEAAKKLKAQGVKSQAIPFKQFRFIREERTRNY